MKKNYADGLVRKVSGNTDLAEIFGIVFSSG
jgi:hypothetical protein